MNKYIETSEEFKVNEKLRNNLENNLINAIKQFKNQEDNKKEKDRIVFHFNTNNYPCDLNGNISFVQLINYLHEYHLYCPYMFIIKYSMKKYNITKEQCIEKEYYDKILKDIVEDPVKYFINFFESYANTNEKQKNEEYWNDFDPEDYF